MLTNDVKRCAYYKAESANVKSRWACYFPLEKLEEMYGKVKSIPNNKDDCEVYISNITSNKLFPRDVDGFIQKLNLI